VMELPARLLERLLTRWPHGVLGTRGPSDRPHLVPVVFVPMDGRIWIPVDHKPKRHRRLQRLANISRDPRCTLLLERFDSAFEQLWWVRLDAGGEVVELEAARGERLRRALAAKHAPYAGRALPGDPPTAIALDVQRVVPWAPAGATAIEASLDALE